MKSSKSVNAQMTGQILVILGCILLLLQPHFFVDSILTDCQSNAMIGGDWIRYKKGEKRCEECSTDVSMDCDKIDCKEVIP
jgi:hypothetical protein